MEIGPVMMALMGGYVVLAAVAADIARSKGHGFFPFFVVALLFCPLASLLAAIVTEPRRKSPFSRRRSLA